MSQPYVGEIRLFAGNFAPSGWNFCNGALLSIAENETLFNLIGTTYGGDGQTTFALPDLRGRVPVHQGPGYVIGQRAGSETVTLTAGQIPAHTHALSASSQAAVPQAFRLAAIGSSATAAYFGTGTPATPMASNAITPLGGNQPHDNMAPTLTINYIISLFGVFPSPN